MKKVLIIESLLSKQSNYGIYNSSAIISEGKLKPIILMATYYHKSPLVNQLGDILAAKVTPANVIGCQIIFDNVLLDSKMLLK